MALSKNKSQNSEFWSLINRRMKMKYIVNNEEVSRDTFYFCKRAKEENKTFVLLIPNNDVPTYINYHPEYDYFIIDKINTYCTKDEAIVKEWFDKSFGYSECTLDDMKERYNKSKFKDTMTFEEWYTKNGWKYHSETKYKSERHNIPATEDFEEEDVKTKLFSIKVMNEDTVKTINEIKNDYGLFFIEYVLRDNAYTEIIYRDCYKEI